MDYTQKAQHGICLFCGGRVEWDEPHYTIELHKDEMNQANLVLGFACTPCVSSKLQERLAEVEEG